MPFCTLVEFEWSQAFGREQFTAALGEADPDGDLPQGCLSRITSIDDSGARVIEVWRQGFLADVRGPREPPPGPAG